jgi:hypothetical protein
MACSTAPIRLVLPAITVPPESNQTVQMVPIMTGTSLRTAWTKTAGVNRPATRQRPAVVPMMYSTRALPMSLCQSTARRKTTHQPVAGMVRLVSMSAASQRRIRPGTVRWSVPDCVSRIARVRSAAVMVALDPAVCVRAAKPAPISSAFVNSIAP